MRAQQKQPVQSQKNDPKGGVKGKKNDNMKLTVNDDQKRKK